MTIAQKMGGGRRGGRDCPRGACAAAGLRLVLAACDVVDLGGICNPRKAPEIVTLDETGMQAKSYT
jgi:hypothetical protein